MCKCDKSKIPFGRYCQGYIKDQSDKVCPYWKYLGKIKYNCLPNENELLCSHMTIFDFNNPDNDCKINDNMRCKGCINTIIKCEYLDIIDYQENSLLWDKIKLCHENKDDRITPKSNINKIELGNLIFHNSSSFDTYEIPRGEWEELFYKFLDVCGFDEYGNIYNDKLEKYIQTKYSNKNIYLSNGDEYTPHIHYFENDTFLLNPYYWGDDEELISIPNFKYKLLDLEIRWYKYPFRDAYSNKQFTYTQFNDILDICKRSIYKELNL